MRLSIEQFKHKLKDQYDMQSEESVDTMISDENTSQIRGGDKYFNLPFYEQKQKGFWNKAIIFLDNIK